MCSSKVPYHLVWKKALQDICGLFCAKNVRVSVLSLWTILSYQHLHLDNFSRLFASLVPYPIKLALQLCAFMSVVHPSYTYLYAYLKTWGRRLVYDHMMGRVSVKMCGNGQNTCVRVRTISLHRHAATQHTHNSPFPPQGLP